MDIPILVYALIGFGLYCHYLLAKIGKLSEQNKSMSEMIQSMALELHELGSPNVFIHDKEAKAKPDQHTG